MSIIAVERALILLRYIVENEDGLSIREASRNLGYSPATVQKLIQALRTQGFVIQDEMTGRYHLGPEAVQLGLTALSRIDVRRVARPHIEALCEESGETVFLAIAQGNHAIYVDKVVSDQPIRMDAPLGAERPYNCTAIGKVLLAGMLQEEVERLAREGAFEQRTENSITDPVQLRAEIEQVRVQGWARDQEEFVNGAACLAVPVLDYDGHVVAAVTVSGPSERVSENIETLLDSLKTRAQRISEELGYSVPKTVPGG